VSGTFVVLEEVDIGHWRSTSTGPEQRRFHQEDQNYRDNPCTAALPLSAKGKYLLRGYACGEEFTG